MEVRLTPYQEALIRHAIESGRFQGPEEAVQEALALWEEEERRRIEILAAVDRAEPSLASDEGLVISEEAMWDLASDVKRRGRHRLDAERTRSR